MSPLTTDSESLPAKKTESSRNQEPLPAGRAAPAFGRGYFDLVDMVVQAEPVNGYDKTMLGMAAYIGIERGKPFEPDVRTSEILERAARDAQEFIIRMSDGVSWVPAETQPGWTRFNLLPGDIEQGRRYVYQNDNGMIDYQRRAAIEIYAYCTPAVLGSGTMYNVAMVDVNDDPIDSSTDNRIRIPEDFPPRSFWSVFAYDSHTRTFIDNAMKGRHLSSFDDLVRNADGSRDVYIGPTAPAGLESNGIETRPGSTVFIGRRTYGPEQSALEGTYKMPRFEPRK